MAEIARFSAISIINQQGLKRPCPNSAPFSACAAASILVLVKLGDSELAIFLALLIVYVIKKYDSRIPIAFALILLVVCAFILAFRDEALANRIAIYVPRVEVWCN